MSTTRKDVLDAAERCVNGDREQDYGSPENNFRTIAKMWSAYLSAAPCIFVPEQAGALERKYVAIDPYDVAAMLALLKIARIASGHSKADNWIDLAGYAACGGELQGG